MTNRILVTYATKYGSTKEVAEAVAGVLSDAGSVVELKPMKEVGSLDGYDAAVLGAPLYMFHLHKDALRFLGKHRSALGSLPVAVFALGPFNDVEKEWNEVRAQLEKELAKFPWFAPSLIEVFGGKFDPANLSGGWKLIPAMRKVPASDIRDWEAIRGWAAELPARLGVSAP